MYSYGSEKEYEVGCLKGYKNVARSKDFINWYNSHPSWTDFGRKQLPELHKLRNVVVVG